MSHNTQAMRIRCLRRRAWCVRVFRAGALRAAAWRVHASAIAAIYQVRPTRTYQTLGSLPALNPGDAVEIDAATYNEVKRWTRPGTAADPIVIHGVDASRPVFDATGQNVNGVLPNPRAIFQVEADFTGTGVWNGVVTLEVKPGEPREHRFPDAFGAYWLRSRQPSTTQPGPGCCPANVALLCRASEQRGPCPIACRTQCACLPHLLRC